MQSVELILLIALLFFIHFMKVNKNFAIGLFIGYLILCIQIIVNATIDFEVFISIFLMFVSFVDRFNATIEEMIKKQEDEKDE